MAFRAIRKHFVIFHSYGQGAYSRESTLTGRRARSSCPVGWAILAKLAIKEWWDGWTTRCVAKEKGERKGLRKENEHERRSARVPTMSMTLRARMIVSLLHLPLLLFHSFLSFSLSFWCGCRELARELESLRVLELQYVIRFLDRLKHCRLQQQFDLLNLSYRLFQNRLPIVLTILLHAQCSQRI